MATTNIMDPKEILEGLGSGIDRFPLSYFWKALDNIKRTGKKPWQVTAFNVIMVSMILCHQVMSFTATFTLDLDVATRAGSTMNPIAGQQMLFKCYAFNKNLKLYIELLGFLKRNYLQSIPEAKREKADALMRKTAGSANKLIRMALTINILVTFLLSIFPILKSLKVRQLFNKDATLGKVTKILDNQYPFDWTVSPTYEIMFVYEFVTLALGVIMATLYQLVLLLLVTALVTHLNILSFVISSLKRSDFTNSTGRKLNDVEHEAARIQLMNCAKDHQKLNKAGMALADSFDFFMTLHLPTSILIMEVGVICVIMSTTPADYIRVGGVIFYMLAEVGFYCYLGQLLETASEDFSRHVYSCEWDDMSPEFRKMASLMLVRTHHPICLRAGRIYRLNLDTLTGVLQLVCSSYTGFSKLMST